MFWHRGQPQEMVDRMEERAIVLYERRHPLEMHRMMLVIVEDARRTADARTRLEKALRRLDGCGEREDASTATR